MLDLDGTELADDECDLLRHPRVGGVIMFRRTCQSLAQVCELNESIRSIAPDLLIAVDQEGGRVQRLTDGVAKLPPLQRIGDLYRRDAAVGIDAARLLGWRMAAEVLAAGFDFSFAPVLDVDRNLCEVIADRSFDDDPRVVTALGRAWIDGMHDAGMAATAKHFPGHGSVTDDSHLALPVDARDYAAVESRDLVPFRELSDRYDAVMPGHLLFPAIDDQPVGFSPFWIGEVLRRRLGFDGVVFSDDLTMKGAEAAGGYAQRAAAALDAGCDMVLVCNDRPGIVTPRAEAPTRIGYVGLERRFTP